MNNRPYRPEPYSSPQEEEFPPDDRFSVASATDCTGLIPSAPASEAEVASYGEIKNLTLSKEAKDAIHRLQSTDFSDPSAL